MRPESKMHLRIERALDSKYDELTSWEIDFLRTIRERLSSKYKTVSIKQKNMTHKILTKVKIANID